MEWAALAEPDADGVQSEHEYCHAQCRLRTTIPYEDYLASELVLLLTACHEGYDHVRSPRAPARPHATTPAPTAIDYGCGHST
jgi:hypothetical protein